MSDLFGGGSDSTDQMLQMQKDEAAEARAKEAERKARINTALGKITAMFSPQGEEQRANRTFDWKTFNPATTKAGAVPGMSGYSFVDLPAIEAIAGRAATAGVPRMGQTREGGQRQYGTTPGTAAVAAVPGRAAGMYIKGPDGKIYKQGDVVSGNVGTGKFTGGFGEDFFNKLRTGIEGFYQPQVAEKYAAAKSETNYRLARAGLGQSSAATEALANLDKQNAIQVGNVRSKADEAAAALKTRVGKEKENAINQVMASENPEVSVNTSLGNIRNITAEPEDLTPLGAIFDIATIGASKYAAGVQNADATRRWGALPKSSGRTVSS